ncbi:MAG TPA: hypothetical protein VLE97_11360 [Gaiellaceae bacterium]|nr:hypothetical protein [Gaiellaceae bacterium]
MRAPVDVRPLVQLTNQAAYDEVCAILALLPDDGAREMVLFALMVKRCKKCFRYDAQEQFSCCRESRGG